jgi:molecular chaperone GrpE
MNPKDTSNEEFIEFMEAENDSPLIDDFIRELEAKEKDLDISSDMVIEIDESEVEHDNIHDCFVPQSLGKNNSFNGSPDGGFSYDPPKYPAADQKLSELEGQVAVLTGENNELKDSLQRRQRDFDNYRGRIERERKEMFKNVLGSLATQILPVIDNLNRALDSATEAEQSGGEKAFQTFLEGIVLVNQQLNEVLIGMGVKPIPAVGEPFDPKYHEAVATVETEDHPPRTVIEELLRGYRIDERIIRASMVKVSTPHTSQPANAPAESE